MKRTTIPVMLLTAGLVAEILAATMKLPPSVFLTIGVLVVIFAVLPLGVMMLVPTGAHHAPRKRPVPGAHKDLPASAEARTETWPAIPAVAHEDPVHDETAVVPAVKDEPTLMIPATPKLGTVDVSRATHETVEDFLGPDLAGCRADGGVLVRGLAGDEIAAHDGDRVGRDHDGVYVLCTEADRPLRGKVAVHGWATGELETVIIDLGREAVA